MLIEITTFGLVEGADVDAFLEADARVQEAMSSIEGIVRRTTARSDDGTWAVIVSWWDASFARRPDDVGYLSLIDAATVRTATYRTLD